MPSLLAVDLGLKTGLALFGDNGKLILYRSHNFGTTQRLRRGAHGILDGLPEVTVIVVEGGGNLGTVWEKEAVRRKIHYIQVGAEMWRHLFLLPREQRSGAEAKRWAGDMARDIISWSDSPRPSSLRHDAAEAILTGLWGVMHLGWLQELPTGLRRN